MIKPLRKRHFQIWIVLAFLLPAGIVAGTVARHGLHLFASGKCEKPAVTKKANAGITTSQDTLTKNDKHQTTNQ